MNAYFPKLSSGFDDSWWINSMSGAYFDVGLDYLLEVILPVIVLVGLAIRAAVKHRKGESLYGIALLTLVVGSVTLSLCALISAYEAIAMCVRYEMAKTHPGIALDWFATFLFPLIRGCLVNLIACIIATGCLLSGGPRN
jgi:hypothetical protein